MELRFGHLCDYAGLGDQGKLILVGIFDLLRMRAASETVQLPLCYLVFSLECSLSEGSDHTIAVSLKDDDGIEIGEGWNMGVQSFRPSGPGRPLGVRALLMIGGSELPRPGDYEFEIYVGTTRVGVIPLFVVVPPTV